MTRPEEVKRVLQSQAEVSVKGMSIKQLIGERVKHLKVKTPNKAWVMNVTSEQQAAFDEYAEVQPEIRRRIGGISVNENNRRLIRAIMRQDGR